MKNNICVGIQVLATPRTGAHQAPLPMEFSREEYRSGIPFPIPGISPTQGLIETSSLAYPALADRFFTTGITWKIYAYVCMYVCGQDNGTPFQYSCTELDTADVT